MRDIRLTRELADQIVFGMENQDHVFYLDLDTQTIVPDPLGLGDADARYVRLPPWRSVDGHNLMARFVTSLRNPIYRERLRTILASGRGAFRQFKDAIGEREDIERLWLAFKQREMRGIVGGWVNDLRELWGLERLELSDDEETFPLIATDFVISEGDESQQDLVIVLDREAFAENYENDSESLVDLLYDYHRAGMPNPGDPDSTILVVETPGQEIAGFVWAVTLRRREIAVTVVAQLYVLPEYRGMGLAGALIREHLLRCHDRGFSEAVVELIGRAGEYEDDLSELGLVRDSGTMRVRLDRWFRENESP
ncbi:MAG: GNAT family N-acetyltransferase [Spirochaetia bacterium]